MSAAGAEPRTGGARRLQRLPAGSWLAISAAACIYLFHTLYSAVLGQTSAVMAAAWALLLGVALSRRWGRRDLGRIPAFALVAALFALTVLVALWSLTPWTPGGPHPVWTYVGQRGSASIDPSATILAIMILLGLACAFCVGGLIGGSDDRARLALKWIIYGGAIFGLVTFLVFVAGYANESQKGRYEAFFISPNTAGTVNGVLLLLAVANTRVALRRAPQGGSSREGPLARAGIPLAAALALAICLLATASRGALGATFAGLLVQLAWDTLASKTKKRWALLGATAAICAAVGLVMLAGEQVLTRFLNVPGDIAVRQTITGVHWRAFLASPLNGYGLGSFFAVHRSLLDAANFNDIWSVRAAHNAYVQWLEEAGLLGAIPMFLTIAVTIVVTVRGVLGRSHMVAWLHGLIGCDLVIILHGWTDFALQTPSVAALWALLLGLQLALAKGSR